MEAKGREKTKANRETPNMEVDLKTEATMLRIIFWLYVCLSTVVQLHLFSAEILFNSYVKIVCLHLEGDDWKKACGINGIE